ncbi:dynein light chain 2B, cytoplasmic [Trypanosoma cruzi]|uniref:Putative dynein light chain 2B, cytoplasmic n=1 Tax=Trypanosoma cruzi TaxID=5693 RepID=A0A2V2UM22_TRYCR|nr:putative dynein light chain 2B, cytoplasmic [Trypanosoma cruzi]PBJ76374.1 dynein light chain 2B, cytoplasmic [Trypanosoma cruzi cruzi]PWU85367.1 putative dynein-associated protein [Trypanosoma cruzi]PWU85382.1 putative dynein light chain 2B, cytoplasmic [Trypanosoma cruzi]RNF18826.1 dynein light chain 2B, cytoplasmic [Trypanosoma cruzi]
MEIHAAQAAREREQRIKCVEEILLRIASHEGVLGYLVLNPIDGSIFKHSGFGGDAKKMQKYAEKVNGLTKLAYSTVRTIDWKDVLTFLRLSVGLTDILVAPDVEKRYVLVVVQEIKQ